MCVGSTGGYGWHQLKVCATHPSVSWSVRKVHDSFFMARDGRPCENIGDTPLVDQLPSNYLAITTADEQHAHQKLFDSFMRFGGVGISSQQRLHQTTLLHIVFEDCIGSLGVICASLSALRINISSVRAFTTTHGVAIDSFEVSSFDAEAERALRSSLESKLVKPEESNDLTAQLPHSYLQSTTPAERAAHSRMHRAWLEQGASGVQLQQTTVDDGDGADVLLHLVFRDVEGSLAVVTAALASCGVNIRRVSCFSTSQAPACAFDTFQLDALQPEAEALLLEQLLGHLSEIEGDSEHGGSRWTSEAGGAGDSFVAMKIR